MKRGGNDNQDGSDGRIYKLMVCEKAKDEESDTE